MVVYVINHVDVRTCLYKCIEVASFASRPNVFGIHSVVSGGPSGRSRLAWPFLSQFGLARAIRLIARPLLAAAISICIRGRPVRFRVTPVFQGLMAVPSVAEDGGRTRLLLREEKGRSGVPQDHEEPHTESPLLSFGDFGEPSAARWGKRGDLVHAQLHIRAANSKHCRVLAPSIDLLSRRVDAHQQIPTV
jgi:hypothetical protein